MRSYKQTTVVTAAMMLMAATTFVCCSSDETVEQKAPTAICFSPVINKTITTTGTRTVAPLTAASFAEFNLWAFKNDVADDSHVMGYDATRGYTFRKSSSKGNNINNPDVWGYVSDNEITFWPSGCQQMQFYGLYPSTASGLELNMTKAAHGFTYDVPGSGTDHDHSAQRDIIAAAATTDLSSINAKGNTQMLVTLTFQHVLSQIVFEAKLETGVPQFEVIVKSIELCNIYKKGTCSLNTPPDAGTSVASWDFGGFSKANVAYTLDFGNGKTLYSADGVSGHATTAIPLTSGSDSDNSDNLMVIPQTVTAWNPATTIETNDALADASKGSYLKINCRIKQNGMNLLSTASDAFVDIYAPLAGVNHSDQRDWDGVWKAGMRYKYTLIFGLGYDSNGSPNGSPIRFTVTTTDWETGAPSDVNL